MYKCWFEGKQGVGPRSGDRTVYFYRFRAVEKLEISNEKKIHINVELRIHINVELKVTEELMFCGNWRETSPEENQKQFFQFMKEKLQAREDAPDDEEVVKLELATRTEGGRFERGPVYTSEHIKPEEPFDIGTEEGKIRGF